MLRDVADDLLAALLPGRCPGCGVRAEPVCDACAAMMPGAPPGRSVPGISWSVAAFSYEGVARELVARVKYRNERIAVRWLADRLAQVWRAHPVTFDAVTWVPASAQRRAVRGVDHGALLARAVGRELGAPATTRLRRDPGPAQTGRPAAERRAGPALHATADIAGRVVLVVDDVVTTGGTLAAAARALRACGARDVLAATVARTPRPGDRSAAAAYTRPAVVADGETISEVPMDIVVVGKHGSIDAHLRSLTVDKVERVNKFASDVRRIEVDYAHHPTRRADDSHTCEILVHVRQHLVKGSAPAAEYVVALDRALDKVEQQMRRLHERRVGRRNGTRARGGARAAANGTAPITDDDGEDESRALVKTKQFSVKPMDVEEATLQMELLGHDFYLFTNSESGVASVVYRRRDGRLGLIEATG